MRLLCDLAVSSIFVCGMLVVVFAPILKRLAWEVAMPALGLVVGWGYDLYLISCRVINWVNRLRRRL